MPRRAHIALLAALGSAAALVALWVLAFHSSAARWGDAAALEGFVGLRRPRTTPLATDIAQLGDPAPFLLLAAALMLVALARERPRLALTIPVILAGANATTQILKPLLAEPRFAEYLGGGQIAAASWPSGHATSSMALALCVVLVAPPRLRPTAAVAGVAFAVAVCFSLLSLGWHFPSDVLGGYLVAGGWTLAGLGALWTADARWPAHTGRAAMARAGDALAPVAIAAGLVALVVLALILRAPAAVADYLRDHTVFVAGALAIVTLGLALTAGLATALRRWR
ncbi:MAG: phosphatase PAP2 family protein [Solirubrobacteraceae bacterium]